jgi:UDP-N-acetylmuramyl pentapeptide phosphotransferase/UDP-N-acetylglucosamine-1-phosphate transferase
MAVAASSATIYLMLRLRLHGALDEPNQRSLHHRPVPRAGGIGIVLAMAIGAAQADGPWLVTTLALALAAVSAADDQFDLPIALRFVAHLLAALGLWAGGGFPAMSWPGSLAAIVAVVWMTNLYNFMDGADGLAGGMALCGFAACAYAGYQGGDAQMGLVCGCIAAGAAGFLLFNFHPARIFMGDVGSIPLGFLAAALGLEGMRRDLWSLWFPIVVFSPFIVDASLTLLRRVLRGERFWQAHREHHYQVMVRSGLGHRTTALLWYALMAAAGASACAALTTGSPDWRLLLGLWSVAYAALVIAVNVRYRCRIDLGRPC